MSVELLLGTKSVLPETPVSTLAKKASAVVLS